MMEDTCVGEKCWLYMLVREFLGPAPDIKNCPFYMEMIWTAVPVGGKVDSAKVVKDCSNRRSLLALLEDIHPRLTGVQKSNEEMRNQTKNAVDVFNQLLYEASCRKKASNAEVISIGE